MRTANNIKLLLTFMYFSIVDSEKKSEASLSDLQGSSMMKTPHGMTGFMTLGMLWLTPH